MASGEMFCDCHDGDHAKCVHRPRLSLASHPVSGCRMCILSSFLLSPLQQHSLTTALCITPPRTPTISLSTLLLRTPPLFAPSFLRARSLSLSLSFLFLLGASLHSPLFHSSHFTLCTCPHFFALPTPCCALTRPGTRSSDSSPPKRDHRTDTMMNLSGASICDEELVQGEARDIQLPNTEHISKISVDVSHAVSCKCSPGLDNQSQYRVRRKRRQRGSDLLAFCSMIRSTMAEDQWADHNGSLFFYRTTID